MELARPPRIEVVYETFEDKENPVTVICKNIYIEFSLIYAIQKSLSPFPTITTLKIEDCCISKELGNALASILTEESGKQIVDLSLDGNPEISQILPLFLSPQTGLKILSLQRCKLDDEGQCYVLFYFIFKKLSEI